MIFLLELFFCLSNLKRRSLKSVFLITINNYISTQPNNIVRTLIHKLTGKLMYKLKEHILTKHFPKEDVMSNKTLPKAGCNVHNNSQRGADNVQS